MPVPTYYSSPQKTLMSDGFIDIPTSALVLSTTPVVLYQIVMAETVSSDGVVTISNADDSIIIYQGGVTFGFLQDNAEIHVFPEGLKLDSLKIVATAPNIKIHIAGFRV